MASLALANLKRVEMERRAALVEAELNAGAEAQRFILPARTGAMAGFSYIGQSRPGQYVGGDFFDVIRLGEHRLAVALADVAGKGIPASVLMAAAQGYLHAALEQHADLATAVAMLNQFVCPRCPANKFMTVFVAVMDAQARTLTYVDAGHGYALLRRADAQALEPLADSNLPIGIAADAKFPTSVMPFGPGSELLVVSDGIIEQPAKGSETAEREQFEVAGVQRTMAAATGDPIARLFDAVTNFAGTTQLADDATAVLVRWATGPGGIQCSE
jgi:serine phosphatase RsbU (regulator of sigma subunit)